MGDFEKLKQRENINNDNNDINEESYVKDGSLIKSEVEEDLVSKAMKEENEEEELVKDEENINQDNQENQDNLDNGINNSFFEQDNLAINRIIEDKLLENKLEEKLIDLKTNILNDKLYLEQFGDGNKKIFENLNFERLEETFYKMKNDQKAKNFKLLKSKSEKDNKEKRINKEIKVNSPPIKPSSSDIAAKIKSVCFSGRNESWV